jgi:hypothetical protein
MTAQEVLKNLETLQKENDLEKLETYISNPQLNHPLFYHVVVEKFVVANNKMKAMHYASQASEFVGSDLGQYFNSFYGNSLGTMICFPLIKWGITTSDRSSIFKILANAYIYLSKGINSSGLKVYDTIRTRSMIIHKYSKLFEGLTNEYYAPYYDTKEITQAIIHDKALTYDAFIDTDPHEAEKAISTAKELTNWYNTAFNDNSTMEEIIIEGKIFHNDLYSSLIENYENEEFHFTKDEYLQLTK